MQKFSKEQIEKLRVFLKVKDSPGNCEKKLWEKVAKYTPLLRKIPGVLCICVWNSLAMNACHKNSDIDLFVITKKNRLWTARILMTLMFGLLWERKTAKKHAGKFCLSFFITENAFNFDNIAIKNDVYLRYWIENLKPILNRSHTFERFQSLNLENSISAPHSRPLSLWERAGVKFWNLIESICKALFLWKTKKSFQKLWKPYGVIITDDILKFHNKDRRKEISSSIFS